jgi:MFS family permease
VRRSSGLAPIIIVFLFHHFQSQMMRPFVPLYASSLGVGYLGIGLIAAAVAVLPAMLALPAGALADRFSPRPLIIIGCVLCGASYVVLWAAPSVPMIIASQLVAGMSNLLIVLSSQSYVGSLGQGEIAERNFAVYTIYTSLGQIGGPLAGGILITQIGYGGAFLTAAALSALSLTATLVVLPRTRRKPAGTMRAMPGKARYYLSQGPTRLAILVSCLMSVPEVLRTSFMPIYLVQAVHLDATSIGWVLALFSVAGLVSKTVLPCVVARFGRQTMLFGLTLTCAITVALLPLTTSIIVIGGIVSCMGLTFGLGRPLSMAMAASSAESEDMGVVVGLRLTGNRLADLLLPLGFGGAAAVGGIAVAFLGGAALMLIGLAALIAPMRLERRKYRDSP